MWKTFVFAVLVLCIKWAMANSMEEMIGESCDVLEANDSPGICTPLYNCSYADIRINKYKKGVSYCTTGGTEDLVCCPTVPHTAGPLLNVFMDSSKGIITVGNYQCRYDGDLPMICRKTRKTAQFATRLLIGDVYGACKRFSNPTSIPGQKICPKESSLRMIGGKDAAIEEFPHMAVLGCKNENVKANADVIWQGGGSLISETFILTAAHVLSSPDCGRLRYAMMGTANKTDIKSGIFRNIIKAIPYPAHDPRTKLDDIALVELESAVEITRFVRPICLPVQNLVSGELKPRHEKVYVAGWGQVHAHNTKKTAQILQKGDLIILDNATCKQRVKKMSKVYGPNTKCASSPIFDTCHGDSGGPLMKTIRSQDDEVCGYYVVAIVSQGSICGANRTGIYTNVVNETYLEWIKKTVWP